MEWLGSSVINISDNFSVVTDVVAVVVVVISSVGVDVHFDFFMLSRFVLRKLRILTGLVLNVLNVQNIVEHAVQIPYKILYKHRNAHIVRNSVWFAQDNKY